MSDTRKVNLRQIIDIDPNFLFVKDREGRFVLVNEAVAQVYGTSVDDLIGKSDADFNPSQSEVEHFRRDDLEVMDSQQEKHIACEVITDATGRERYLSTIKRPVVDDDGVARHVLGVATDITQLKLVEAELRDANRALRQSEEALRAKNEELSRLNQFKSEFMAIAAHELRTPLTSITGYLGLIMDAKMGEVDERMERPLLSIQRNTRRLRRLVEQILEATLLENGGLHLLASEVDVVALVADAIEELSPLAEAKEQRIDKSGVSKALLRGDPDRLQQVLVNLLANAIKYSPVATTIEVIVSFDAEQQRVRIVVRNPGSSIAAADRDRIFEPFFRAGRPGHHDSGPLSAGLGLYIARGLVERHGGTISLGSGEASHTEFEVELPVVPEWAR